MDSESASEILKENLFETANTTKKREKFFTTGCPKFDAWLQGGISCRGITQIYGAAGTGKTQLALQLCLTVQLPIQEGGLGAGAVYICTQSRFPSRRFQELIEELEVTKKHGINGDSVFVTHISAIDELEKCLLQRIPELMSIHKIGLIIIDSVSAPYRVEDWQGISSNRAKSLRTVGKQLHKLNKNDDICVICINQVTAAFDIKVLDGGLNYLPALGNTWLSMVTNSIQLYRTSLRYACIRLSSNLPETTIPFEIHGFGVKAMDEMTHRAM